MYNINEFSQIEIKKEQLIAERLSTLIYLDSLLIYKDVGRLWDVVAEMKKAEQNWPCRMRRDEWFKVMDDIQTDINLSNLWIVTVEDIQENVPGAIVGHRAVLFENNNGDIYVIFRGTGSHEEWEDNAKGMYQPDTLGQNIAAQFVKRIYEHYGKYKKFKRIIVAGHSKGGNKAQYATITLPNEYIDLCFSFDGQGFSAAFLEKYKNEIEQRKQIIHLVSERRGFVHALGFQIKETIYYSGRRGDRRDNLPYGEPLGNFHAPDALRNAIGMLGMQSMDYYIPYIVNLIVRYYLETPKYLLRLEETALGLTALIHDNIVSKQSVNAITNMLLALIDLIAESKSFRKQVKDMAFKEADVILATIDKSHIAYSGQLSGELSDLVKAVIHNLANTLGKDRRTRINFIKTIRFVIDLRHEFTTGKHAKLIEYIVESIHLVLTILTKLIKDLAPILNLIQTFWRNNKKNHLLLIGLLDIWRIIENKIYGKI
ncbi:MAG: DUF2974 domain-containing protein [Defluviitaleaceae bacterium]|nr:DUF2974 domain-containing protein [Defluviitaleaceae bacterium]